MAWHQTDQSAAPKVALGSPEPSERDQPVSELKTVGGTFQRDGVQPWTRRCTKRGPSSSTLHRIRPILDPPAAHVFGHRANDELAEPVVSDRIGHRDGRPARPVLRVGHSRSVRIDADAAATVRREIGLLDDRAHVACSGRCSKSRRWTSRSPAAWSNSSWCPCRVVRVWRGSRRAGLCVTNDFGFEVAHGPAAVRSAVGELPSAVVVGFGEERLAMALREPPTFDQLERQPGASSA